MHKIFFVDQMLNVFFTSNVYFSFYTHVTFEAYDVEALGTAKFFIGMQSFFVVFCLFCFCFFKEKHKEKFIAERKLLRLKFHWLEKPCVFSLLIPACR